MLGLLGQFGMREEAEHAQPVVDGDQDNALLRQPFSVEARRRPRASLIAARMNPDHHGLSIGGRGGCGPDVQEEAILGATGCGWCASIRAGSRAKCRLRTNGSELIGFPNTVPMHRGLRLAPA